MSSYTKLFGSILTSSIWSEDNETRLVWITMLAMANWHGEVISSIPGLAHHAHVPIPETEAALKKLLEPDPYSSSPEFEGRRIEVIPGGWLILNHRHYREKASIDDRREQGRIRQQRFRDRHRNAGVTQSNSTSRPVTKSDGIKIKTKIEINPSNPDQGRTGSKAGNGEDVDGLVKGLTNAVSSSPFERPSLNDIESYMASLFPGAGQYAKSFFDTMEKQGWRDKKRKLIQDWRATAKAYANKAGNNARA